MAAHHHILEQIGAKVLALSTDSVYAHKVFAETSPSARKVQFPLVSDRNQCISKTYGVLREDLGFTFRATFIIAPGGEIKYSSLYPAEVARNVSEIIRIIHGLQHEAATGEGIPAGWHPGKQGIKKDFSRAGRY